MNREESRAKWAAALAEMKIKHSRMKEAEAALSIAKEAADDASNRVFRMADKEGILFKGNNTTERDVNMAKFAEVFVTEEEEKLVSDHLSKNVSILPTRKIDMENP